VFGRRAGVLAHPTSLPGPYGIGDLGPQAEEFLDWCAEAGLRVWQVLPVGPTGLGYSPYSGLSAFAGNPMLISPAWLVDRGWLSGSVEPPCGPDPGRVDFERVIPWKLEWLRRAWERFRSCSSGDDRRALEAFVDHPDQRAWLEDWTLYTAIKRRHGGRQWTVWDADLRRRHPSALRAAARELADELAFERFLQFLFFTQWGELRAAARKRGILILGDLPFYPAHDSADVWARPDLFLLDERGVPLKVAGVPPDYFSEDGQLWGNPVYDWARLEQEGYAWWIARIRSNLALVDWLRLDHFRAFVAFWEVDANAPTAAEGRWVPGPGVALFEALRGALGRLPLVAEDLGEITPDVHALRDRLELPGMRVLQFGFHEADSLHHPRQHVSAAVAYTGTHDNDTLCGWLASLPEEFRQRVSDDLGPEGDSLAWRMIEVAYGSVANTVVVPLQDLLQLGSEARMNRPGVADGNWRWRADGRALTLRLADRLRTLARSSARA